MKNALISLALLSGTAHAASTVELTVKGLITPMACTPLLSGGGLVDFGKISRNDLIHVKTDVLDIAIDPQGGDIAQLRLPLYPRHHLDRGDQPWRAAGSGISVH